MRARNELAENAGEATLHLVSMQGEHLEGDRDTRRINRKVHERVACLNISGKVAPDASDHHEKGKRDKGHEATRGFFGHDSLL